MYKLILILLSLTLISCATQNISENDPQSIAEGDLYLSPNQLVSAEMLIHKKKNFDANLYVGRGTLKPGAVIPEHTHVESDEILVFQQGGGELLIDGSVYKIRKNEAIFIPKGTKHSYSNRTKFSAKYIQIYNPSGPETKFKKWAKQ